MDRILASVFYLTLTVAALAQPATKPVAVVNGEAIPRSEFDAVLKLRPMSVTPMTAAQQRELNEQILSVLVDEVLIRQFLNKNAPPAPPAEVDKQYAALLDGLKSQGKSITDFCKETQQTDRQVRSGLEIMLRWNAYQAQKLSEPELQKYYAENKDFFDKVTVHCSHIVIRIPQGAPASERAESEKKLRDLRQQITDKKLTFAEAAQKYSHCPSAPKGGDLGPISRKWMVEEPFAKAAFALKPGEVSDLVTTDYGVHLILVTERKPGEPSDYAKIKNDVRDCCGEEMRLKLISDLRKSARIEK